jgi:hypothetical protein
MPTYLIEGKKIRADKPLTDSEIDEIAANIKAPVAAQTEIPQRRMPSLADVGDRATGFRAQVAETGMTPQERQEAVRQVAAFTGGLAVGPALGAFIRTGAAAAPAVQRFATPIATTLETGGFKTGLPATAGRGTRVLTRAVGGGVTGGAAAGLVEPEDIGAGAAAGTAVSVLFPPVAKVVAKGAGYIADAIQGRLADVRANQLVRATIGDEVNQLRQLMAAEPDAPASRIAAQQDLPVLQALLAEAEQLNPTGVANAFRKAESDEIINDLAKIAGGKTSAAAKAAEVKAKKALNIKTTPMREKALSEAAPVDPTPLVFAIDNVLQNPSVRNDDFATKVVQKVKDKIVNATGKPDVTDLSGRFVGKIDPTDLYEIRKSAINNAITELNPSIDAKSRNNYVSQILGNLRDKLDTAMEDAGGEGFKKYLNTFEAGMIDIEDARLANRIRSLYEKGNTASQNRILTILKDESPEVVQRVLKSKRYQMDDILKNDKALLNKIERGLGLDIKAAEEAKEGAAKLARIREEESVRVRFPFFSRISTALNEVVSALEAKLSRKTMDEIINAAQSGREFNRVLDSLSTSDRNAVLRQFKDVNTWNNFVGQVAQASQAQATAEPRNRLAPASANQMRP